jgi:hypothetical protein
MLASRPLMLASLLGASIGVPYVVSQTNKSSTSSAMPSAVPTTASKSAWPSWGSSASTSPPPPLMSQSPMSQTNPGTMAYPPPAATSAAYPTTSTPAAYAGLSSPNPANPVRYHSIQEVLRFNLSREWVYQNWDRKSTGLGDPQFFGIRVPLVTGTQRGDLAGSLTYQFDTQGAVQHISFRGRTADTTPLVQFLTQTYQFQRMDAPAGEQLYQVRSGNEVFSELRTRPESVLIETSPQGSFAVVLELGRPGSNRALVPPPPKLDIPQVASPPEPPAAEVAKDATGDPASESNIYGKFRAATQDEHNQVFEHRWPN